MTELDQTAIDLLAAQLRRGERVRVLAQGGSMRPFIAPGDPLLVTPPGPGEPAPGDVVLAAVVPDKLFCHRMLGWRGGLIVTRGDASPQADEPWPRDKLLGIVRAIDRPGASRWWLSGTAGLWAHRSATRAFDLYRGVRGA